MVRGAIAYALVLKLEACGHETSHEIENDPDSYQAYSCFTGNDI